MRLDYLVSHSTGLTRKAARDLLRRGCVSVNGTPVTRPGHQLREEDQVRLDGELLSLPGHQYLMLNKPAGVVCVSRDGMHSTVVDLVAADLRANLHPAGRLDRDTTGLVLLTTDGAWSHRVTAPASKLEKCYLVELADPVEEAQLAELGKGLLLRGETRPTRPARYQYLSAHRVRLWISEGRYHQVKRMFAALNNRVTGLHREAIGEVSLDAALSPGEYRPLTDRERVLLGGSES